MLAFLSIILLVVSYNQAFDVMRKAEVVTGFLGKCDRTRPEVGSCEDQQTFYFFNSEEGKCMEYEGCPGAKNSYESKEACEKEKKFCTEKMMSMVPGSGSLKSAAKVGPLASQLFSVPTFG